MPPCKNRSNAGKSAIAAHSVNTTLAPPRLAAQRSQRSRRPRPTGPAPRPSLLKILSPFVRTRDSPFENGATKIQKKLAKGHSHSPQTTLWTNSRQARRPFWSWKTSRPCGRWCARCSKGAAMKSSKLSAEWPPWSCGPKPNPMWISC
jgi:hypothetical protein